MHPAKALWACHHPPRGYPTGVIPVPEPLPGLAFFPGGYGLWGAIASKPLPEFPVGGVMVLGHDFHSEVGYAESHQRGGERETMPTWSNLLRLFHEAGVPLDRCFFTNVYMGLRAGRATTGPFPGRGDATFVAHCQAFLADQLRVQQPTLVLTLGVHVPPLLAQLSPDLAPWMAGRGIKHLDAVGPVQRACTFPAVPGLHTTLVALLHPSLRHASLRHRRYGTYTGADAELAMLRDGMVTACVV